MRWVLGCLVGEERKLKFFSSIIWLCRKWDKKKKNILSKQTHGIWV